MSQGGRPARLNNFITCWFSSQLNRILKTVTVQNRSPSYQRRILGKSHQSGDYLKQAMRKSCFPTEFESAALDYRSTALPLEPEKHLFACLMLAI